MPETSSPARFGNVAPPALSPDNHTVQVDRLEWATSFATRSHSEGHRRYGRQRALRIAEGPQHRECRWEGGAVSDDKEELTPGGAYAGIRHGNYALAVDEPFGGEFIREGVSGIAAPGCRLIPALQHKARDESMAYAPVEITFRSEGKRSY